MPMPLDNPVILSSTYELREEIGSGGGGVIYKARHLRLNKDVVLKKLKAGTSASLETQRAETDILKSLTHTYLPQLYDFVVEGSDVYTVIDYIPGQSLDKMLAGGQRFSQRDVIKWAGQLCDALNYMHKQKPPILHSDIKPANVMLTPQGDIRLIDFNISLLLGDEGAVAVGRSHGYASPEQYGDFTPSVPRGSMPRVPVTIGSPETELADPAATVFEDNATQLVSGVSVSASGSGSYTSSGKTILDVRSDIYSLGATLYHLLSGERPARSIEKVKPLSSFGLPLSEGVIYIIEKAMSIDPAKRFRTAEEMLRAVRNIHKLDRRWKIQRLGSAVTAVLLIMLFAAGVTAAHTGYNLMGREKVEQYGLAVLNIESAAGAAEIEALFDFAAGLFPDRLDAFRAKALALFRLGQYDEVQAFIEHSLIFLHPDPHNPAEMAKLGDIHYIAGGCYFEYEDYSNAVIRYRATVEYNQDNAEYYRDYAIALARAGDITAAEEILKTVEAMKLSGDSLDLLRGEIAYAKGQYRESAGYFQNTIRLTRDDYVLYRAYRILADSFKRQNDFDAEIALLTEAYTILPPERVNELTERLADAYVRGAAAGGGVSYYQTAAQYFEELLNRGYETFRLRQNLAIVYHQMHDLDAAERVLLAMEADYPQDYRIPMRLAYLYADMQSRIENEHRNYAQTREAFDKAQELYIPRTQNGYTDPEMLMLRN
ncbi:MAG: serine/threonine-protein kinase [Oscillospiraceae bacterium]|nr:serine/threonine-protein kinase [Oscillospiraceae bacterium]